MLLERRCGSALETRLFGCSWSTVTPDAGDADGEGDMDLAPVTAEAPFDGPQVAIIHEDRLTLSRLADLNGYGSVNAPDFVCFRQGSVAGCGSGPGALRPDC